MSERSNTKTDATPEDESQADSRKMGPTEVKPELGVKISVEESLPPPQRTPSKTPQRKSHIAKHMQEAVLSAEKKNRSSDLVPLNREYDVLRKRLRALVLACKNYAKAMTEVDRTRIEMVKAVVPLATNSPMDVFVGDEKSVSDRSTYVSINKAVLSQSKQNAAKYQDTVLDYAMEWERSTTTRVDKELNVVTADRSRLKHYEDKVEGLRRKVNNIEAKNPDRPNKGVPARLSEKLSRNEDKLKNAYQTHERSASSLCDLLEEVTERGWKYLFPLVKAVMEWEDDRSAGEMGILSEFPDLLKKMESFLEEMEVEPPEAGFGVEASVSGESDAAAAADGDDRDETGSDTTGSYHSQEDSSRRAV